MLQTSIFFRTWRELLPYLFKWGVGLTIYAFVTIWMTPLVSQPAVFSRFSKIFAAFSSIVPQSVPSTAGYWIITAAFLFILPLVMSISLIWAGGGLVAKSEENGELTLWLAQPVARWQIILQKYGALLTLAVALTVLVFILMLICNWLLKINLSPGALALGCLSNVLTALTNGSLAFLLGVVKGRTTPSRLIGLVVMVLMYLLFLFPSLPNALRLLSPFTINASLSPLNPHPSIWTLPALLGVNVLLYLASQIGFEQRDLNI
ncbi:MAG: ABC transporter permease subunit [Anaerolineales bacterium]